MAEKKDRLHLANFPGIEEAFGISFNENEFVACAIDKKAIDATSRIINHHEAVTSQITSQMAQILRRLPRILLKRMVGPCGLEPQTSTVSI